MSDLRERAFCANCQCGQPIAFSYVAQPGQALSVDVGGRTLTKVNSDIATITCCSVCGYAVTTKAERARLREEELSRSGTIKALVAMGVILGVVVLVCLILQ